MHSIVLVGCGNIGKRHVQGIQSRDGLDCRIYLLDKFKDHSLKVKNDFNSSNIHVIDSTKDLPEVIDVAIIATDSKSRFAIFSELIQTKKVQTFILEKVVFNDNTLFIKALDLLKNHESKAYINYPRRLSQTYKSISGKFKSNEISKITVEGKNWGLLCNTLHFLDLIESITEEATEIEEVNIDNYFPSKRSGYVEAYGEIKGTLKNGMTTFSIKSHPENHLNNDQCLITTFDGKMQFKVNETKKKYQLQDGVNISEGDLDLLYQSELTGDLVHDLVFKKTCSLPELSEIYKTHISFNEAISADMMKRNIIENQAEIPIT